MIFEQRLLCTNAILPSNKPACIMNAGINLPHTLFPYMRHMIYQDQSYIIWTGREWTRDSEFDE
jgi:hypothetical protein